MIYLAKWWLILSMVVVTAAWIIKPEMLDRPIKDAKTVGEKITGWNTEKEKTAEFEKWMQELKLPTDCQTPATNVRILECKNMTDLHAQNFARYWANRNQ